VQVALLGPPALRPRGRPASQGGGLGANQRRITT